MRAREKWGEDKKKKAREGRGEAEKEMEEGTTGNPLLKNLRGPAFSAEDFRDRAC